jgi:type IV pilus assembly protein PilC
MPVFQYSARDMHGQLVRETVAFNNEIALREHLRKNNLFLVTVAEQTRARFIPRLRRGVGLGDLIIMTRQLRTMINAGMPLVSGLEALAEQCTNPALAEVLDQVSRAVGHGASLAATLEHYPRVFPPLLTALVAAGEEGGRLPETLQEASRQLEQLMEIRQKLISAMIYPLFTLAATCGTVLFMLFWVVPVFAKIYADLKATLPPITLLLVAISNFLISSWWLFVAVLATAVIAFRQYYRTPEGRLRVDGWKLRMPLCGGLFQKSAAASLTGALAGLLESGVPLIQALTTAAGVSGNEVMAEAARKASENAALGRRLSDEFEKSGQFPIMVVRMVAIAEEVGTLPMVLREIAAGYNQEVEYAIRRIMTLIEPIMVLIVAAVVGFVLVALYYPIFMIGEVFLAGA